MTKKGKPIATATDALGNIVITTDSTWRHIEQRHPEMAGKIAEVQQSIKTPDTISDTPQPFPAFAYSRKDTTTAEEIRVIVAFDTANIFTGTATGYVSTAYPPDPAYGSAVGKVIWTATPTTPPKSKPGGGP